MTDKYDALNAMTTDAVSALDSSSSSSVPSTWELNPNKALPTLVQDKYWPLPAKQV